MHAKKLCLDVYQHGGKVLGCISKRDGNIDRLAVPRSKIELRNGTSDKIVRRLFPDPCTLLLKIKAKD